VYRVCDKYLEKQKEVFVAFMDLEKAYDRVDRQASNVGRIDDVWCW
jgi:hypothetical protein